MLREHWARALAVVLLLASSMCAAAETPRRSLLQAACTGLDVTKPPFSADPTGKTDSATAINKAFAAGAGNNVLFDMTHDQATPTVLKQSWHAVWL